MTILNDRYELYQMLGEGGMAQVFRAIHLQLDREVAIKFIREGIANPEFAERFKREASVLAKLDHPNVIQIYDFDQTDDGRFYMAMQLLHGSDLAEYLDIQQAANQPLSVQKAISIVIDAAKGLHYAHSKAVVHRDVKPSNIFLTDEGRVVVMDFGIAKLLLGERFTQTDMVVGTPHYFAPEQGTPQQVDHRADIYALGAVLFQLLTGKPPFQGDSAVQIIAQHLNAQVPIIEHVPASVQTVIKTAMAKDPANRYSDMQAMITALASITLETDIQIEAGEVNTIIAPTPATNTVPDVQTVHTPVSTLTSTATESSRQVPYQWIVAAVLLIFMIAGAVIGFGSGNNDATTTELDTESAPSVNFAPASDDEYLVVVADIVGDEALNVDASRRITQALEVDTIAAILGNNYRVESTEIAIDNQADAVKLGQQAGATLVVWGVTDASGIEINFEAPLYPEGTLNHLAFIVPNDDDFANTIATDMQAASTSFLRLLLIQKLISSDNITEFLLMNLEIVNFPEETLGVLPVSALDEYALNISNEFSGSNFDTIDENLTRALTLVPNDPTLLFMRWSANTVFTLNFDRSETDAELLQEILGDATLAPWFPLATAYLSNDFDTMVALLENVDVNPSEGLYPIVGYYYHAAWLKNGDFAAIQNDVDTLGDIYYDAFGFPVYHVSRYILGDIQGDTTKIEQAASEIRRDRALEQVSDTFVTMPETVPYGIFMVTLAVFNANDDLIAANLIGTFGEQFYADDYYVQWQLGRLAMVRGDHETALDYYQQAVESAPVPFPIAAYDAALIVAKYQPEGEDACEWLAQAQALATTDSDFYAVLVEQIDSAQTDLGC